MKQISKDDASNNPAALVGVGPLGPEGDHQPPEVRAAKELARRYRLPFVELLPTEGESPVDYTLFNEIPVGSRPGRSAYGPSHGAPSIPPP